LYDKTVDCGKKPVLVVMSPKVKKYWHLYTLPRKTN